MDHKDHANHINHSGGDAAADFLRRFWVVTALLIPLLFLAKADRPYLQFGIASVIFYFALIFFKHAGHEIKTKSYGMMTLVSLAVGAGYLFSAASTFLPALDAEFYLEISTLIWILLFGHYLEAKSSAAAGDALGEVAKLLPKKAHLIVKGKEKDVSLGELKKGDVVVVKPGEKIPADGIIIKGEANLNESLISGESKPVKRKKNKRVIAGSICLDGTVRVSLDKVGESSTIGQIKKLVSQARETKPSAQRMADKAAGILTLTALVVAVLTALVWLLFLGQSLVFALTLSITVLVIACPHALGLAIPTVSTIATSLAVKHGLFIKDLKKMEVVKEVDYVVFDKTGTLTKGDFGVVNVVGLKGRQADVLKISASLEANSSHPIGLSIVEYVKQRKLLLVTVSRFKNIAGKGIKGVINKKNYFVGNRALMQKQGLWDEKVESEYKRYLAQGKTVVIVANEKEILGLIILADQIKKESKDAIRSLHNLGVKTALLTGDNERVAQTVAEELGIDTYFAEVQPKNKYQYIKKLQEGDERSGVRSRRKVMMVGDGVNDAPALTQADVGVAIGAGTEVAVEAGDVVLTRSNPLDIVSLIVLGRKVYRKMIENLVWALGYNVIAIPAAAGVFIPFGFRLRPEVGAILMSLSSVIVVVNAVRLRKVDLRK